MKLVRDAHIRPGRERPDARANRRNAAFPENVDFAVWSYSRLSAQSSNGQPCLRGESADEVPRATAMAYRRSKSSTVRSTEKQPSSNAEHWVENPKRQQKMWKNSRDSQRYEHQGNEHHSVQYTSGDNPSATGEATE